jgi:serine/threonine-protein kinase PknK
VRNAAASANTSHDTTALASDGQPPGSDLPDLPGVTDIQPLGRSGAALRYRASQPVTGRPVEVLVLDGQPEPRTVQGFVRDGTIGARLSGQSGVVPVFDAGVTASGLHYLVRPYYSRGSLGRHLTDSGPLPWREAVALIEQITATTAEIHGWGIVHQGLEPGNIMLTEFLGPMIRAFGASLPVGADLVVGVNPSALGPYAAPELGRSGPAEPTIDVYSLGAILWALLAGRDPDPSTSQAPLPVPVPAPDAPAPLVDLIHRAMSRQVHERPATAAAFATELARCIRLIDAPASGPGSRQPGNQQEPASTSGNGGSTVAATRASRPPPTAPAGGATTDRRPRATTPPPVTAPFPAIGARAKGDGSEQQPDIMSKADTRYILALVAVIAVVIVVMVLVALLGVE